MLGFRRRAAERRRTIERLHNALVDSARAPRLFDAGLFPDTVGGRFESLALHTQFVVRRLRELPPPALDVAQELVDAVFSHLEIALRESGIGDFGVPKRMKGLARSFYDRLTRYEKAIEGGTEPFAAEIGDRLGRDGPLNIETARYFLAAEKALAGCDLSQVLAELPFGRVVGATLKGAS